MSELWQPDYKAEFGRRLRLLKKMQDPKIRAATMLHYRTNPCDWINDWVITYDPRRSDLKTLPFIMFPRQRELVQFFQECLHDRESGLVEKCRDAGATWISGAYAVWLWLFVPGSSVGFGSRKEMLVDRIGDPDSIFGKMRMIIERLPAWMRPSYEAPYMKIVNHANGATITGESGDNIGRGARKLIYFKDESAHYERPMLIEAALSATTDVQIDISSVNGSNNIFYNRRMAGSVWTPDVLPPPGKTRVFIFDWRDDPRKTQEWYDQRRAKAEAEGLLHIFAQEVDRDYSGSQERVIIPQPWVQAAIDAHVKLSVVPSGAKVAGQDIADGGGDKNALAMRYGVVLSHISHWGGEAGESPHVSIPKCVEFGITELYYDSIGVGVGFKTTSNLMKTQGAIPQAMKIYPWDAGAAPQDPTRNIIPGDKQSPTNEDQYQNLKAQAWFRLRARFWKTYRAVTAGEAFHPDEIISLDSTMPGLHELCMELSQAVHKYSATGKTLVDKKPDGATSPNMADAVVMCYNPVKPPVGYFSMD